MCWKKRNNKYVSIEHEIIISKIEASFEVTTLFSDVRKLYQQTLFFITYFLKVGG